jgi:hypothetical protein
MPAGTTGCRVTKPDGQLLDRSDVGADDIPQEDPGNADAQDQKEGKVIRGQAEM